MSKTTQVQANLAHAQAVRTSGYPTRIHELPDFKAWFDAEYAKGGKTINTLHREGSNHFPQYTIPSAPRLKSYVQKYLCRPVMVAPYTPEYQDHIRSFDSYIKLLEAARELWRRYTLAEQRESQIPGPSRVSRSHEWLKTYLETLRAIVDIEVKLGLRSGLIAPNSVSLNQINIHQEQTIELSSEKVDEVLSERHVVAEYLQNYDELRQLRNGVVVLENDEYTTSR